MVVVVAFVIIIIIIIIITMILKRIKKPKPLITFIIILSKQRHSYVLISCSTFASTTVQQ